MLSHKYSGLYIDLEGPDGGGKSTQLRLMRDYLLGKIPEEMFLRTREPGGTQIGEQIRGILHDRSNSMMTPLTELLGYTMARAQLTEEVIKPHLAKGGVLVGDRCFLSSLAYQGYGHNLDLDFIWDLSRVATQEIFPDLVIYFEISPEEGFRRIQAEGRPLDLVEERIFDYQKRVAEGYKALSEDPRFSDKFLTVDATRSIEEIQEIIRQKIDEVLIDWEARAEIDNSWGRRR